jgi:hypothetical protein
MRSGLDTENLFRQLNVEAFPYREFRDAQPEDELLSASANAKWSTSLEILQREWLQAAKQSDAFASEEQPVAPIPDEVAEQVAAEPDRVQPPQQPQRSNAIYRDVFPDPTRVRLRRLFHREAREEPPVSDTPLADLFDRIS